jgi:hypothetical protein
MKLFPPSAAPKNNKAEPFEVPLSYDIDFDKD